MSEAEVAAFAEAPLQEALRQIGAAIGRGEAKAVAEGILGQLSGEASWRREAVLERLKRLDEADRLVPLFANALHDPVDPEHRNAARSALATLAAPDSGICALAMEALSRLLLDDPDVDVRLLAAAAIGESGSARGRVPLERALADPEANVASSAAESLGLLADRRAVPALLAALNTGEDWTRVAAVVSLGRLGDPAALPRLGLLLDDPLLAHAAVTAIGEIRDPAGVDLLEPVLTGTGPAREPALGAVAKIHGANPDAPVREWLRRAVAGAVPRLISRLDDEAEPTTARLLGIAGTTAAAEALLRTASDEDLTTLAAVGIEMLPASERTRLALGNVSSASPRVRTVLLDTLPPLTDLADVERVVRCLGDTEPEVRAAAAEALGRSESAIALDALVDALDDPDLRLGAALALGRLGTERCDPLLDLLEDASPEVRVAAIDGLARCGYREASALVTLLQRETDARVRRAAVKTVGEIGGREVIPHLVGIFEEGDPSLRFAAVRALGRSGAPEALEPLLRALDDELPEIRIAALNGLGDLGDIRASRVVDGHLEEPSREIRRTAARALDRLGGEPAVEYLQRALRDGDREVRLTAIETVRRLGGPDAVPALEAHLDAEADPTVRDAASRTLLELRERGEAPS